MFLKNDIQNSKLTFSSCGLFVSRGDWIHPEFTVDTYEIIFVLSGKVHICEDGCDYVLSENDLLLLSPGKRHFGIKHSRGVSFYWLHFSTDMEFLENCFSFPDSPALVGFFRNLLHVTNTPFYPRSSAEYLTRLILNEISYLNERIAYSQSMAYKAAEYAAANASATLSVGDVAEHFGYNPDYLCRIFRKSYNMGLKKYIDEEIIKKAKRQLLQSGISISEIGKTLGFENGNLFSKFFKYHEGMTPSQFAAMHYNTHINH